MSEYINNREYRQKVLKGLITELHGGKSTDEIKPRFEELIQGISPAEISEMEQSLIMDGMPLEEIQRLCDVHAAVFKGSIEEIHRVKKPEEIPGHPVHTFKLENKEIERLVNERINPHLEAFKTNGVRDNPDNLAEDFGLLWNIDKHYLKKENLLFPFMEKYGITAPPKVMWGVDDEIRALIKETRNIIANYKNDRDQLVKKAGETVTKILDMIFKEENILFPMVLETLAEDEWVRIAEESHEIGYCLVEPGEKWKPAKTEILEKEKQKVDIPSNNGYISLETGILLPEEISSMLNALPLDITFVDKEGAVKYFSQGKERIFPRTKAIIGRQVQNCHPPASVHIVERIVEDLKAGRKDHEDFWIRMGEQFIYIRYFAVRNEKNEFMGVMEVTQNIRPIQGLTGEKRLLEDK
ncbi:MAG: DUF438 domain-containing protein [Ruminiclostridium sp.]|nr:DUF438 domain-containing protein [Ruminiclostridium sp.]